MRLSDVMYDFERDEWVAYRLIHARWVSRELPPPFEEPQKGRWYGKPDTGRRRLKWSTASVIASIPAFYGFGWFVMSDGKDLGQIAFGTLFVGLSVVVNRLSRLVPAGSTAIASPEDLLLLEDPEDRDTCLVEITIFKEGREIGRDRGVAWFDSGRLMFNGHRTSFAIGGEDVLPRRLWVRQPNIDRTLAVPFRYSHGAYVRFQLLTGPIITVDHQERFVERLGAFRSRPPQSRGPRQWPLFE